MKFNKYNILSDATIQIAIFFFIHFRKFGKRRIVFRAL